MFSGLASVSDEDAEGPGVFIAKWIPYSTRENHTIATHAGTIVLKCQSISFLIKGLLLNVPGYKAQKPVLKGFENGVLHSAILQSQKLALCPTQLHGFICAISSVQFLKHSLLDER